MVMRLPASDAALLPNVLAALGWEDRLTVHAVALGTRRLVVCELDENEHEARCRDELPPATDPLLLHCLTASRPGFLGRPAPVHIYGTIAIRKTWRSALNHLAGFAPFGAQVAVVPEVVARRLPVALDALYHGFGVIALERPDWLVHSPDLRRDQIRTWIDRLVEEVVYDSVLRQAPAATRMSSSG